MLIREVWEEELFIHLLQFLPLQVTVVVLIVVGEHYADKILLAVIILSHKSRVIEQ